MPIARSLSFCKLYLSATVPGTLAISAGSLTLTGEKANELRSVTVDDIFICY